jgi:hypothetical protein
MTKVCKGGGAGGAKKVEHIEWLAEQDVRVKSMRCFDLAVDQ